MADDSQRPEIGASPPVADLVPELADAALMASCDLCKTCRKELEALVRLYEKRYVGHRENFLNHRKGNKPLSKNEISRFHRQWREYVRGVVEPMFTRARRTARLQAFVREQEQVLGCKLVGSSEARDIVPILNLKILAQKGRLRQVQFEKLEIYHAEDDLKRIAVEDAEIIEKKRKRSEADQLRKARAREEATMKRRLFHLLYVNDVERQVIERVIGDVLSFKSVQDLLETDHFTTSLDLTFPEDCVAYLEKVFLSAEGSGESSRVCGSTT